MPTGHSRRGILVGSGALALSIAGCLGSSAEPNKASSQRTAPVAPDSWPAIEWQQRLEPRPAAAVVAPNANHVYVMPENPPWRYTAYSVDGQQRWEQTVESFSYGLGATDSGIPVVTTDGRFVEIDGETGTERWEVPLGEHEEVTVAMALNGDVYAVTAREDTHETRVESEFVRLERIDSASGDRVPLTELPGEPTDDWRYGTAIDGALYLGRDDGVVAAYDPDGIQRWQRDLRTGADDSTVHTETTDGAATEVAHRRTTDENLQLQFDVVDDALFVGVAGGVQTTHALTANTGAIRWEVDGYQLAEAVDRDRVVLVDGSDEGSYGFAAVNPTSGRELWSRTIDWSGYEPRVVGTGGLVYAAFSQDVGPLSVRAIDAATGDVLDEFTRDAGVVLGTGLFGDRLVVATTDADSGQLFATALLEAPR